MNENKLIDRLKELNRMIEIEFDFMREELITRERYLCNQISHLIDAIETEQNKMMEELNKEDKKDGISESRTSEGR